MARKSRPTRPSFHEAWVAFSAVRVSVAEVGRKIGGNVQKNIDAQIFQNACPIRMSYVLNAMGYPVVKNPRFQAVRGADKKLYLFRVNDMMAYLEAMLGRPEKQCSRQRHRSSLV